VRALVVGARDSLNLGLVEGLAARGWSVDCGPPSAALPLDPPLDLLVHSWVDPAALQERSVADTPEDVWTAAAEGSLRAAIDVAQRAFPALRASGHGRIVYVVPTIGSAGAAGFSAYCAAAEGLRALAKSLAKQWGKYAITANSLLVAPQLVVAGETGERLAAGVSIAVPALGGPADPATDLAPVVALLASDDAHYATGSTLSLDGGLWTVL
jgi:NAD(P)-dependent dehydrogenase (short-subunit alcohol dehydrogenase family)